MNRAMLWATAIAFLTASCSPHKVNTRPTSPVEVPNSYSTEGAERPLPERWWRDFGDPELNRLVELSLRQNLQIRAAWARLEQVRALTKQAASGKYPQVNLDVSASRRKTRFDFGPPLGEIMPEINTFNVSVGAAYEVDLWRRQSSTARAATIDAAAAGDDIQAMAISIAAEIADTWFQLITQRATRKLIDEQVKISKQFLKLVTLRFEGGLASALDVYQQRQQLVATKSRLALTDAAVRLLENKIAVLVGRAPGKVVSSERADLPSLPPLPGTGVPADLVVRRPDVRAARRRVVAADYRVAAAVADRLPGLRLSGSTGSQDSSIAGLIAAPLWSLIGSLTAPLLDGGRRKAEVRRNKAIVKERLLLYGQSLIGAMTEVENALVQEKQQALYIVDLTTQVDLAKSALDEAQRRYQAGLTTYLQVLTSLVTVQQAELGLLQARRQALSYRVQLCRALGGTWTAKLTANQRRGK